MPIVILQLFAILRLQTVPVEGISIFIVRDDGRLLKRRLRLLIRHFKKQQIRELLNVVAVTDSVVAEDVAVVPETLDNL